jgi:riboflavin synthase
VFSGIIEEIGIVRQVRSASGGMTVDISAVRTAGGAKDGESIAVNGVCLTVEKIDRGAAFTVSLSPQTRRETTLGDLKKGDRVNLERALALGDRLGGHLVSGHADCVSRLTALVPRGKSMLMKVRIPEEFERYVVRRGSLAVDGVSLTVAEITGGVASGWLIPYTLSGTTFGTKKAGDRVNLEFDMLAKYVEKLIANKANESEFLEY